MLVVKKKKQVNKEEEEEEKYQTYKLHFHFDIPFSNLKKIA